METINRLLNADTEAEASERVGPLILHAEVERWALLRPFRIAGYAFEWVDVLVVSLEKDGVLGRGEAAGVYYKNDTPALMIQQIEALRTVIEAGLSTDSLQKLLPPCGTRNAIDCALWDLRAKLSGRFAWQLAKLKSPQPLVTTMTCGADEPDSMAVAARAYTNARAIKIKLLGEVLDIERVRAVRAARPDVWLGIDGNQGFTRALLERIMPALVQTRVNLIEQPFAIGCDEWLDGFQSPIPIAADESVQSLSDIPSMVGRFDMINIKLDKCGGLTEALAMARVGADFGLDVMVGNMISTSLAMAPAFLVGQLCQIVDLDGPLFLSADRTNALEYVDGMVRCPQLLWG